MKLGTLPETSHRDFFGALTGEKGFEPEGYRGAERCFALDGLAGDQRSAVRQRGKPRARLARHPRAQLPAQPGRPGARLAAFPRDRRADPPRRHRPLRRSILRDPPQRDRDRQQPARLRRHAVADARRRRRPQHLPQSLQRKPDRRSGDRFGHLRPPLHGLAGTLRQAGRVRGRGTPVYAQRQLRGRGQPGRGDHGDASPGAAGLPAHRHDRRAQRADRQHPAPRGIPASAAQRRDDARTRPGSSRTAITRNKAATRA